MHAMHFVALTFVDISEVGIFYFGNNNIVAFAKILNSLFYFTLELLGMW